MILIAFVVVLLVILVVAGLIADGSEREDAWRRNHSNRSRSR